jgi:ER-bound oxygenase mpaB/B'/Rubber oxygenase, catalytic domain
MAAAPDFSDARLDDLRTRGDETADRAVAQLADAHPELGGATLVPALLERLVGALDPEDPIGEWLEGGQPWPAWVDRALLEQGRDFFRVWGLQVAACLFAAGLPWDYAAASGAETLAAASDLASGDVRRRIAETGQFLFDVHDMCENDGDDSQCALTIRGVRLLHAGVRRRLLVADPGVVDRWGYPLNQEDLLGTLLSFTVVSLDAMARLGVYVPVHAQHAYMHLWNVVGLQLGIDASMLPLSLDDARALQRRIEARQHTTSPAGARLTTMLMIEMERSMPRGLRKLPRTVVRRLVGSTVADLLGVPAAAWWSPALAVTAAIGRRCTRVPGVRLIASVPLRLLARAMIRGYIDSGLAGRRARFRVDDDLMRQWRIGHRAWRRRRRERRAVGRSRQPRGAS